MKALLPVGAILFLTACGGSSSTPGITSAAFVESISANPADYRIGGVTSETPDGDVVSVSTGLGPDGANATVLIDIASDLGGTLHGTAL